MNSVVISIDPEFKALIPPLSQEERAGLEANIKAHGCRVPLDVWDGVLVDGHNRFEICTRLGISFETKTIQFADKREARIWIRNNQMARRNLPDFVKVELQLENEADIAAEAKERQIRKPADSVVEKLPQQNETKTRDIIGKAAGVSGKTVDNVKKIKATGTPELQQAVREGRVSISAAAELTALPEEKQREIATSSEIKAATVAKELKAQKHAERKIERLEKIKDMPWPSGKYRVIYADPPWSYDNAGLQVSAAQHYETMSTDAICALPVRDLVTKDSVLFMWATSPLLPDALRVIEAWGFTYKTSIIWDKERPNFGNYVSVQHEFLFIATRGACTPDISERPGSVMRIERTARHSEKPSEFRDLVNMLYPHGPRIELFARVAAEGWERWGNEAA